jgi:hypothetical protein
VGVTVLVHLVRISFAAYVATADVDAAIVAADGGAVIVNVVELDVEYEVTVVGSAAPRFSHPEETSWLDKLHTTYEWAGPDGMVGHV